MKQTMKRLLPLLLAAVLLAGCAAGPGGDRPEPPDGAAFPGNIPEGAALPVYPGNDQTLPETGQVDVDTVTEVRSSGESAAADETAVDLNAVSGTLRITEAGDYRLSGRLEGQIVIEAPDDAKVKLILDGVEIRMKNHAAVYAISADKLVLRSAAGSSNLIGSSGEFVQTDDNNVDAAVFAKCDLTLGGEGAIGVTCETGHGIVTKDDLKIKGDTLSVEAAKKGLSGKDSVTVEGGTISLICGGDGVHTDGNVDFIDGNLILSSGDDGVHADGALTIDGGELTVAKSKEGLEAHQITINGGVIRVAASDDGLNASGGKTDNTSAGRNPDNPFATDSEAALTINGGRLSVNAGGDGLDSNGYLTVNGGFVVVSGPTNGGNGAIDYGISGSVHGGTVIAAGSSGMAESFGRDSTQGCIFLNVGDREAGTTVSVSDESGNLLAEFSPEKSYQTVVVSAPGMIVGGTYTVTAGSFSQTVTLDSIVYGEGSGFGGPGFPGGPGPGGAGKPGGRGGR